MKRKHPTSALRNDTPRLVTDEAMRAAIWELRLKAWKANGPIPDFLIRHHWRTDDHDIHGLHWAIWHEGQLIAASRLCFHLKPTEAPDPESLSGYETFITPPDWVFYPASC